MKEIITSSKNQQLKNISILLKSKKERDEQGVFITEGIRIFKDTLKSGASLLEKVYFSESYARNEISEVFCGNGQIDFERNVNVIFPDETKKTGFRLTNENAEIVRDSVFEAISGTVSPQGVFCVVRKPEYQLGDILNRTNNVVKDDMGKSGRTKEKYLLLEDIQDPGNLGTMIRTAEAAGVKAVIMSSGTADIFNPKVTRATMGSIFRVPFVYVPRISDAAEELKNTGIAVYAAYLHGGKPYREVSFEGKHAILIGNEGNGLTDEAVNSATDRVFIPMEGEIESLNAAVAAAILMFA